ncbi:lipopolysaccharide biosynthesis protein [Pseudonocardia adelaidensis]|uniref:O-antigen/teichoic acid export membrane protein n=1 Tax=Pseudonocardia adelaidensis TaxID=648754 RepID=A0ABP9NHH1_9PSEU
MVLEAATVRPDHFGRTHPDPRADPPTVVLDPSRARTEELQQVGPETPETSRIPVAPEAAEPDPSSDPFSEADTADIPIVGPGGGRPDGSALALSALLGSAGGLVGWLVAAHVVPVTALGDAQLVVSVVLLLAALAPAVIRPMRGQRPARVAWMAPLLVVPPAAVAGLACGLLVPRLAGVVTIPGAPAVTGPLIVAAGCAAGGLLAAHDVVLAGAGKPGWVVWRSALFAPVQIGAVVALCAVAGLGADGVVLSWLGPAAAWAVPAVAAVPLLLSRASGDGSSGVPAVISLVGTALLYHLVPIVVTVRFGSATGAVFFVAWQVFVLVDLGAAYTVHALAGAVAREPGRTGELVARARRRLLIVFLPLIALGAALAGPLLTAFGPAYADAGDLLRLMLLGLAFRLVVTHELGVRQALGHGVGFDRLQLFSAVLVLVVAIALPGTAGDVTELRLVAIGYIIVQVACAAAVLVIPAARRTDVEVRAP